MLLKSFFSSHDVLLFLFLFCFCEVDHYVHWQRDTKATDVHAIHGAFGDDKSQPGKDLHAPLVGVVIGSLLELSLAMPNHSCRPTGYLSVQISPGQLPAAEVRCIGWAKERGSSGTRDEPGGGSREGNGRESGSTGAESGSRLSDCGGLVTANRQGLRLGEPITLCYISMVGQGSAERRRELQRNFSFHCDCHECR